MVVAAVAEIAPVAGLNASQAGAAGSIVYAAWVPAGVSVGVSGASAGWFGCGRALRPAMGW